MKVMCTYFEAHQHNVGILGDKHWVSALEASVWVAALPQNNFL